VGDASHWDGANANQVKAELIAVAAKVGVDDDENAESHDYKIDQLVSRKEVTAGGGTLAATTQTTVTDATVTTSSVVLVQGTTSAFYGLSPLPYVSALNAGSFVLTHGSAAGTEGFDYIVVN
jgi:hypothetical protein